MTSYSFGVKYYLEGWIDESEAAFQEALKLVSQACGNYCWFTPVMHTSMAGCREMQKRFKEAEELN